MRSPARRTTLVRQALACWLLVAAASGHPAISRERQPAPRRPNILFILSDDHAANALGCYGSRLAGLDPTPRLDRLAQQGVRLTHCFATNSICVPSRASILTGQYSHVNGVYSLSHALPPASTTFPLLLQEAGYRTGLFGKWHLKTAPEGFDEYAVLEGQGRYRDPRFRRSGSDDRQVIRGHSSDVITDLSIDWLDRQTGEQPFCLLTWFKTPHEAWQYPERMRDRFDGVEIPEPDSLWEDKSHRSAGSRDLGFSLETMAGRLEKRRHISGLLETEGMSRKERKQAAYQRMLSDYLRTSAAMDDNIGRLIDHLESRGILDDTLVVYTSDQGYFLGEHDYIDKRWMFEESIRMPFLARLPAEIPAGSINEDLITNVDLARTLLDYAGVAAPEAMWGRSFRENLAGRTPTDWRRSIYYHYWQQCERPAHYGVRTRDRKLIFFHGVSLPGKATPGHASSPAGFELYDLANDPFELRNVYADPTYRDEVSSLKQELLRLKQELGDRDEDHPALLEARRAHWND